MKQVYQILLVMSRSFLITHNFLIFFPVLFWHINIVRVHLIYYKSNLRSSACNAMIMCGSFWFSCFQRLYFIWSLRVHVEEYSRNALYALNYISTITTHLSYMNWTLKFQIGTTHDHGITCRLMAWYFDRT
jgi:hypothetical protein